YTGYSIKYTEYKHKLWLSLVEIIYYMISKDTYTLDTTDYDCIDTEYKSYIGRLPSKSKDKRSSYAFVGLGKAFKITSKRPKEREVTFETIRLFLNKLDKKGPQEKGRLKNHSIFSKIKTL
ncbi:MAG: hypothetical protein ACOCV8_03480, partial [Spirochaetota bacterium]